MEAVGVACSGSLKAQGLRQGTQGSSRVEGRTPLLAHMGGERWANLTSKDVAQEQHCLLAEWGDRPVKQQEISWI